MGVASEIEAPGAICVRRAWYFSRREAAITPGRVCLAPRCGNSDFASV